MTELQYLISVSSVLIMPQIKYISGPEALHRLFVVMQRTTVFIIIRANSISCYQFTVNIKQQSNVCTYNMSMPKKIQRKMSPYSSLSVYSISSFVLRKSAASLACIFNENWISTLYMNMYTMKTDPQCVVIRLTFIPLQSYIIVNDWNLLLEISPG